MKKHSTLLIIALALGFTATALQAHHSFSMFDSDREEVVTGSLVRWAFNSPHVILYLEDADGTLWGFEGAAPPAVLGRTPSMDGFTFQPGDQIAVVHCPLRDGRPGGAVGGVITADGTWYNPSDGGCNTDEDDWRGWLEAGFTSRGQAEAAS